MWLYQCEFTGAGNPRPFAARGLRPRTFRWPLILSNPMTKKSYTEEFRRDAVEVYRDTDGATVAGIAADLGISHGSLTTWLRNAGIAIRRSGSAAVLRPGTDESPEQEAARLRAEVAHLRAQKTKLETERNILRSPGQLFRRRDELVNRFHFVAEHLRHLPGEAVMPGHRYRPLLVPRMDQRRAPASRPGPARTSNSPRRSAPSTRWTTPTGGPGSPPRSTQLNPRASGSITNGSHGSRAPTTSKE